MREHVVCVNAARCQTNARTQFEVQILPRHQIHFFVECAFKKKIEEIENTFDMF